MLISSDTKCVFCFFAACADETAVIYEQIKLGYRCFILFDEMVRFIKLFDSVKERQKVIGRINGDDSGFVDA